MQKVESWPQLQDAIKTSSQYKHCHKTYNIISGTAECESLVVHTFSMVTGLFDTSHFATSSFDTS